MAPQINKKYAKIGLVSLAAVALIVGLSVGLTQRNKNANKNASMSQANEAGDVYGYCPTGKSGKSGGGYGSAKAGKSGGGSSYDRKLMVPGTEDYKRVNLGSTRRRMEIADGSDDGYGMGGWGGSGGSATSGGSYSSSGKSGKSGYGSGSGSSGKSGKSGYGSGSSGKAGKSGGGSGSSSCRSYTRDTVSVCCVLHAGSALLLIVPCVVYRILMSAQTYPVLNR